MKYLITGGAGFIGSHLVDRLLQERDNQIIVIDDFSVGKWENLPKDKRLITIGASILDDIGYTFEDVNIVFHLAAKTRPQWSMTHAEEANVVNIQGTLKVLENCRDNKVGRIVFASSSSIYGPQEKYPIPEDAPLILMSPYAVTKVAGENYCKLFGTLYGLKFNCIRPFNVYGTRQNPEGGYAAAVPNFITRLRNNQPGEITGNGNQSRDFTYVDDVVNLMILASESKVYGESFNAGAGHNISINDLYSKIAQIMGKNIKPVYIDPVVEPPITLSDTSKSERLLGWRPKFDIDEGLRRTVEGF